MNRHSADVDAIKRLEADWRAGWQAGDVEGLLALLADDCVLMPWGRPALFGRDAVRPLYQEVFREYAIASDTTIMDLELSGDLGYFWCQYTRAVTPRGGGVPMKEEGKSLFVVRRERGAWKIARVIDNSDQPPDPEYDRYI